MKLNPEILARNNVKLIKNFWSKSITKTNSAKIYINHFDAGVVTCNYQLYKCWANEITTESLVV